MPARIPNDAIVAEDLEPAQLRVRFRAGEPAYALFGRLAARNLESSCRAFARQHRLRFDVDILSGHATPEVARLAGLEERLIANHTVTQVNGAWVELHGEFLRSGLIWRGRTFCPLCFGDDLKHTDGPMESRPFRRSVWDVRLFQHCPVHCTRLASACPSCGKGLDIDHASPWRCRCGQPLNEAPVEKVSAADCAFERYILGRLGGAEPVPAAIFDALPLMVVEEVAYQVGRMLRRDQAMTPRLDAPRRATLRHYGVTSLAGDADVLMETLGRLAHSRHASTLASLLPVIRAGLPETCSADLDRMVDVIRAQPTKLQSPRIKLRLQGPGSGSLRTKRSLDTQPFDPGDRVELTLREAAALCGMGVQLFRAAAAAGLIRIVKRGRAAQVQAENCRDFARHFITAEQLAREHARPVQGIADLLLASGVEPLVALKNGGKVFERKKAAEILAAASLLHEAL